MAIATPITPVPVSFPDVLTQIQQAREEIQSLFQGLAEALKERETFLLNNLSEMEGELREKLNTQQHVITRLEVNRVHCMEDLKIEMLKDLMEVMLADIDEKLGEVKRNLTIDHVRFRFSEDVYSLVSGIGTIDSFQMEPDALENFCAKIGPVVQGGKTGKGAGKLNNPYMITIDPKTDNIYVANCGNGNILVFSPEAEYLFEFGEDGEGEMTLPVSIAISDNKVYVAQKYDHCVNVYELNGTFLDSFGVEGDGDGELDSPQGVVINEQGHIYVCDSNNNRIVVFDNFFNYDGEFTDEELKNPADIKISCQYILVIADYCDSAIFFRFNLEHDLVDKMMTPGVNCCCFCFDENNNLIVSDIVNHCVHILTIDGTRVHQIGNKESQIFYRPYGVAIDRSNRIIVVDEKVENCIQLF